MILNEPLTLPCGATLANRVMKPATSEALATAHMLPTPAHASLYARWARGGAGLLVTGNVMIDRARRVARGDVVLDADAPRDPFAAWARAAAPGTALWMQLNHPGRQSPCALDPAPVAPSAIPMRRARVLFAAPSALTGYEIELIVERFAAAAALATSAGFSGVQIHGAHGYLVHQFLSPRTNARTDGWGGTGAKRRRFLLAIVRACRAAVGAEVPLAVKLSAGDTDSLDDVEAVADAGIDLVEISGGTYEHDEVLGRRAPVRRVAREGYFSDFAAKVRGRVKVPLALTGGFRTPQGMARAVGDGLADVVGLARPLVMDPDLPRKIFEGRPIRIERLRALGVRSADAATELAWYERQIHALAHGDAPDAAYGRGGALLRAASKFLT